METQSCRGLSSTRTSGGVSSVLPSSIPSLTTEGSHGQHPRRSRVSAPFCVGAQGGNACNQDQNSDPVVATDGSVIYVAFESLANADPSNLRFGSNFYLVVHVNPATGGRVTGPYIVSQLV